MYKSKLLPLNRIAADNTDYYRVVHTTPHNQIAVMSIPPHDGVGPEVHNYASQFVFIVRGKGTIIINGAFQQIKPGDAINIAAGFSHEIRNADEKEPLKFYSVYSHPQHPENYVRAHN